MFERNPFNGTSGFHFFLSLLVAASAGLANAQSSSDVDGDGVPDLVDNCLAIANGPNDPSNQTDTDRDGYGNACDADYDNTGTTNIPDFARFITALQGGPADPATDHNDDGRTTVADFGVFLAGFGRTPGPSGLDCADPTIGGAVVCEPHEHEDGGATVSEQEAFEIDVALLAEAKELPVQDVHSAIAFQEDFLAYAKDLEARNPGQFSRIWLEPIPARAGVIEFTGDVPSENPPNGVKLLGQGRISQSDHERRAELVAEALRAKDITNFTSFFDVPSGKIVVEVNEQTGQTDNSLIAIIAVAAITESSELGGEARSITAEDLDVRRGTAFETDYSRGGENMTDGGSFECTSGWAVEGPNGDGIVTAAHCTGLDGLNHTPSTVTYFHNTTWRDEERGQGDSEYHTTTNLEVPEFSARDGEIRDVLSKKSTFWILPGQSICRYGRSSDFRDCSHTVLAKNVTATFTDGVTVSRLVQADGDSAIGGDSGGGWSWGSKAWGVHSGSNGTTSVFTPIGRVERELSVDLMIHP